ncbi:hypothetical protein FACS189449_11910 [Alphaproteobacteria bacterium]|nr:hypothetical protein FACS189449_11910 [Alphaproteobacteria bacterium]
MLTLRATDGSDAHKTDTTSTQPAETSDGKDITVGGNASTTTTTPAGNSPPTEDDDPQDG